MQDEVDSEKGSINAIDSHYAQVTPRSYQFKALMRKNFKLQIRQRCTLCCQIAVPLILVLFVGAMQVTFDYLVKDQDQGYKNPEVKNFEYLAYSDTFFMGANIDNQTQLGYLNFDGSKAGFLGEIQQYVYQFDNITYYTPFFQLYTSRNQLMKELSRAKEQFSAELQSGKRTGDIPFPTLAFTFFKLALNEPGKAASLVMEVLTETQFPYLLFYPDNNPTKSFVSGISLFANLFVQSATNNNVTISNQERGFPYKEAPLQIDIGSLMAALTYPLVLSWLLPVYLYNVVLEKQDKLREMMKMMGLKMRNYWLVTFIYNAILYLVVLGIVYGLSYAFSFAIFTKGSVIANLVTFLMWGFAQIGLGFLFSAIFGSTRVATIFSYFLVIIQVIVSYVINATVFQLDEPPFFWMMWPPFAFYRIIYVLGVYCGLGSCYETNDYDWGNEITHAWVYLFFSSLVVYLLAFYLDAVLPKEFGIAKKPWFFLSPIFKMVRNCYDGKGCCAPTRGGEEEISLLVKSVPSDHDLEDELHEPDDVAAERNKVYSNQFPHDAPIIIRDLNKVYGARLGKNKHVAVKNLTIAIPRGECFGLLGPNGAGKTTTISILTGLFPPTAGTALVGGFDISTDIDLVHRVMGVCPQFDTLWMDLTCEETLLFYARVKGVAGKDEHEHVMESLRQVGLDSTPTRLVKDLSGGMRRRLSVAVALVGNPRIVFLDEPTTGLDPESRRQLWDVLTNVKVGRCIILTTHSMEEADVLCTTIGIMSKGMLRTVGPQQQLKQRFGQGYTLKINFDVENASRVDEFMAELLPTAKLGEDFAGSRTYQIPAKDVVVSELFATMEKHQDQAGITDWGINQTSLEDVFLHICRDDEGASVNE